MSNILIISGHSDLSQSVVNRVILEEFAKALPDAQIRRLDSLYPDYRIDVQAEQAALLNADVIVWQFPFYWYAMPALMKKWLDDVFVHGFAHGSTAKLGGKKLLVSITAGAPAEAYAKDGFFRHEMADYFAPFQSTALLCGLDLAGVEFLNGVSYVGRDEAQIAEQQADARAYAQKVIEKIKVL